MKNLWIAVSVGIFALAHTLTLLAVEVAPHITDREIVEALVDLRVTIKAQDQKIEQQFKVVEQQFKNVDQQFKAMDQKMELQIKAMDQKMDQQFKAMDQKMDQQAKTTEQQFKSVSQRMDDMVQQMSSMFNMMLTLSGIMTSLIVALFGYITWDRYSMVKPLRERVERLEHLELDIVKPLQEQIKYIELELYKNFEIKHPEGSILTRLLKALRERSQFDDGLASALRANLLLN